MNEMFDVKFKGKIFENVLDLRDIVFLGKKISNITDKAYSAYTGNNSDIKNKYQIITKEINHASLDFQLLLDYGAFITPLLMDNHTTVLNTITLAIDMIQKIGKTFSKDKSISINNKNSTITDSIITNGDVNIIMPIPAYTTMLGIDKDVKDINKKISLHHIDNFSINNKIFLNSESIDYVNKGLELIENLKEERLNTLYKAELSIYECNKNSMTGKAILGKNDLFGIETKDTIDLDIPHDCMKYIIHSMSGDKILVEFEAVIENVISKKILKRIIIKNHLKEA